MSINSCVGVKYMLYFINRGKEYMEKTSKVRESSFELMRIISMFMIVVWHVIICGVGLDQVSESLSFSFDTIKSLFVVHVNSFVLLTGYFQSKSKFRLKKVFSLVGLSWFYRILAVIVVLSLSLTTLSNLEILNNVFILPLGHEHWFIHFYILLYLVSPFLNIFIERTSQSEFKKLLLVLIGIVYLLPYLSNQGFYTNDYGFSFAHFIVLYFIGAYFRMYPIKESYHFKNLSKKNFRILLILVFLGCAFFSLAILYLGKYVCNISYGQGSVLFEVGMALQSHAGAYDYPLVILQTCAYVLFFSTISFKNKIINRISTLMIGIYLIHESELFKPYIYEFFAFNTSANSGLIILLQIFGVALMIFILSGVIEFIRQEICKLLKFIFVRFRRI